MKTWIQKIFSIFDFYKELEENHQIYYIEEWKKTDYNEVILRITSLSSGIKIEKPIVAIYRNKSIYSCLSKDDQQKIDLYMAEYGSLSIYSIEYQNTEKMYNLLNHENSILSVSESELFEKHLTSLDKSSLLLLLKSYSPYKLKK